MKLVDTDALGVVNRALGVTGRGAQETELTDGILNQNLDVNPMVRRGRTLEPSEGIFYGVFQTVHLGGGNLNALINPYRPEIALRVAPYPAVVPAQFDVWLLYATVTRVSGSGTIGAVLDVKYDGQTQGWGVNNSTVKVTAVPRHPLAFWDNIITGGSNPLVGLAGSEQPLARLGYRFPRIGTPDLNFATTASAISTWQCTVVMGLFPVSMGQDAMIGGL